MFQFCKWYYLLCNCLAQYRLQWHSLVEQFIIGAKKKAKTSYVGIMYILHIVFVIIRLWGIVHRDIYTLVIFYASGKVADKF